jgi:membrane protease subunit (stomatin/prohibitin family)
MTIRDFIHGELIDIVEWLEDSPEAMAWRFVRPDNEIKNGARLVVRPAQIAVFVDQGEVADVFEPGTHALATRNLPVLSRLRGWKYGFESPFKAEVVFVSTRQFANKKWGTKNPVITRDADVGPVRLRAYGTFSVRVGDAARFIRELVGANAGFVFDDIGDQLRNLVVSRFGDLVGEDRIPVLQLSSLFVEVGDKLTTRVQPDFANYGLDATQVVVENISLPPEVEQTLDQKTRLGIIGDMGAYQALVSADALRDAARNPGGGAAGGVAVGVGFGMAQQMAGKSGRATPAATPVLEPPPIPGAISFFYAVGKDRHGPSDLATLAEQVRAGTIGQDTLLWRPGMAGWTRAGDVAEVASLWKAAS